MFLPPQNALRRRAFKEGHFIRKNSIVGAEERQQGQDDGSNLGGDYNGVIIKYQKYIMK